MQGTLEFVDKEHADGRGNAWHLQASIMALAGWLRVICIVHMLSHNEEEGYIVA
jgi:hypothetical protein